MSESGSLICLWRFNYKVASCCICVFYMCLGGLCTAQMWIKYVYSENFIIVCWNFSCTILNGGIGLSLGLLISSILTMLGIFINQPFLIIPLMVLQILLFIVVKINFAHFLNFLLHEENSTALIEFFISLGFVFISGAITIILWVLYCEFIQLSFFIAQQKGDPKTPRISDSPRSAGKPETSINSNPSRHSVINVV